MKIIRFFLTKKRFPKIINCGSLKFRIRKTRLHVTTQRTQPAACFPCHIVAGKYFLSYRMIKCDYIEETFSFRKKFSHYDFT